MATPDELVGFFQRHIVPIFFTLQREQDTQNFTVTTFVLSVADHWFLITAGHCVSAIETLIKDHGYEVTRCLLIDSMGLGAMHPEPIPFAYKEAYPIFLSDECAFDYGIIAISPHYRRLLQANKVQPLNEEVWKSSRQKSISMYS